MGLGGAGWGAGGWGAEEGPGTCPPTSSRSFEPPPFLDGTCHLPQPFPDRAGPWAHIGSQLFVQPQGSICKRAGLGFLGPTLRVLCKREVSDTQRWRDVGTGGGTSRTESGRTVDSVDSPGSLRGGGARAGMKSDSCPFPCGPHQLRESEGDTDAGTWGAGGGTGVMEIETKRLRDSTLENKGE